MNRVLGVDPGTRVTGWGVVARDGDALRAVAAGTLRPPADASPAARLAFIHRGVLSVLREHAPQAVVVEEAFAGVNARSAIRLGEARAVCLLAAELSGVAVHELPPALVKKAVAGHGQAGKETVRDRVVAALRLSGPLPALDAADALGLAITALARLDAHPDLVGAGLVGRRRRRGRRWSQRDVDAIVGRGAGAGGEGPVAEEDEA